MFGVLVFIVLGVWNFVVGNGLAGWSCFIIANVILAEERILAAIRRE